VQAQHRLPPRREQREVLVGAREERGGDEVGRERDAAGGDEGVEQAAAVAEGEAWEVVRGGGNGDGILTLVGLGLEEEDVGVGLEGGEAGREEVGGLVAVEEEDGGAAVGVGEELEDGGPSEARGEVLRDGAGGDDGEEARDGGDEVAELGVLVGPEGAETPVYGTKELKYTVSNRSLSTNFICMRVISFSS